MIIGVKYWNRGSSAPATWTDLHVAECESDFDHILYDAPETMDGTIVPFGRNRYFVRIVIDPFSFNHATYGPVALALRTAHFCRIKDARYSWLEDGDTIDFVVPDSRAERDEPSLLTRSVTLDMKAMLVH